MGRPIFKLTGRSRLRRPWWAPWSQREEYEVYIIFWGSDFVWYTEKQVKRYLPHLIDQLPE